MTDIADYASSTKPRSARAAGVCATPGVLAVWAGLFLVRPRLALAIWRERRCGQGAR